MKNKGMHMNDQTINLSDGRTLQVLGYEYPIEYDSDTDSLCYNVHVPARDIWPAIDLRNGKAPTMAVASDGESILKFYVYGRCDPVTTQTTSLIGGNSNEFIVTRRG